MDMDIPGLVSPTTRAFHFVRTKVCVHLGDLSRKKQDVIVRILEGYEPTVFETRDMPRLVPHRQWDLNFTEVEGAWPVAGWPYLVSPQHLSELNQQIMVLEQTGTICSLYSAPVLLVPNKDGKLRLCIDYCRLNHQTLRDCYPTTITTDLIARTRGVRMFLKLDLHSEFHQLRIREGFQHKTAFVKSGWQYK